MNTSGTQSQNQPNRNDQAKSGQPSHQGTPNDSAKSSTNVNEHEQHNQERPSNEAPIKGGQPPQSGNKK